MTIAQEKSARKRISKKIEKARTNRFNSVKFWDGLTQKERVCLVLMIWDEGLYHTPEYRQREVPSKNGNQLSSEFKSVLRRLR